MLFRETELVQNAIMHAPVRNFAVPHLVIDNVFPEDLVARINELWPDPSCFQPEVPGNHVFQIFRRDYQRIKLDAQAEFWKAFNETLWPNVVAATAAALAAPGYEVFGDLYRSHLSLEMPLTLMQADPTYPGHSMHTHFYHCPHWAFTMLLYIDPEDCNSRGTALHRLLPQDGHTNSETSYVLEDLDWRTDVAMDTFHWLDPKYPDRRYDEQVAEYRANRLFVFLDGPLAFHSVPFDSPDHLPNPARARDEGRYARRRILRSHVKVSNAAFYRRYSPFPFRRLKLERYGRTMAPDAILSQQDQRYRNRTLRRFFHERLATYAHAAATAQTPDTTPHTLSLFGWRRRGPPASRVEFTRLLAGRIP